MMRAAIDLSQELSNLQRFELNFANEPDVVIPTPYPELSRSRVLTMTMLEGTAFTDRAGIEAIGWDVDALVRRATEIYLEMIFRDGSSTQKHGKRSVSITTATTANPRSSTRPCACPTTPTRSANSSSAGSAARAGPC